MCVCVCGGGDESEGGGVAIGVFGVILSVEVWRR